MGDPMLGDKLQKAINEHINAEFYSAYLYASIAAYFDAASLPGFSHWMRIQVQEELAHGAKLYDFVNDRGGRVLLTGIEGPPTEWPSPLAAFQHVAEHEREVSRRIDALMDLAMQERDHMAKEFIQWFVAEQVEEEANADKIVQDLRRVGDDGPGLLMIDRELAGRVYAPPADAGGA
jgi:ferritin